MRVWGDATPYPPRFLFCDMRPPWWLGPVLFVAMVLVAASVSLRFFRFGGGGALEGSGWHRGGVIFCF